MDPRLLRYYNQELQFLREMGGEFARQFPKIAGRLGMEGLEVADPYVERLLEGSAFLTARLQYKLDAEYERFTQRLLEITYPGFLAPIPSMIVARFDPELTDGGLAKGVKLARGTVLRGNVSAGETTACEFTTAQDVTLFPLSITEAKFFSFAPDLPIARLPKGAAVKGGLRIKFRVGGGLTASQLQLDKLNITLSGAEDTAYQLYELVSTAYLGALVVPPQKPITQVFEVPASTLRPMGYEDDEALLPVDARSFQGYRLVQEYFTFPQRFLSFELAGLRSAISQVTSPEFEIVLLFGRAAPALESMVDQSSLALFATPAINLRKRRADRINVGDGSHEFQVLADRTRSIDYEVYSVDTVTGFGSGQEAQTEFLPLYSVFHTEASETSAYFTARREQRLLSHGQKKSGPRSSYVGTEVFLSIVDPKEAPYAASLKQLSLGVTTSNRDLPLFMPVGQGSTDLTLEVTAPVRSIRCIRGPTRPYNPLAEGALSWRLISHLSLNHYSLQDTSAEQGAAAIRAMLGLYLSSSDVGVARQIDGIRSLTARPTVRRLAGGGPLAFGRGTDMTVELDELFFQGGSAFLLGSVLERFLARHASANSFTEFTLKTLQRGKIMQWEPRCGTRAIV
jgi:type VI secretion system protein ImpG